MNKKHLIFCMISCIGSAALMNGCAPKPIDTSVPTTEISSVAATAEAGAVTPDMIYEARTPYLGDAPAAGNLTGLLKSYYEITQNHTMELQTKHTPYGMTLHFEDKPDNIAMQKMSAVLISLIDNCSSVSWDYPSDKEGNHERFYFSYENMPQTVKKSTGHIKEYAESDSSFQILLSHLEAVSENLTATERGKTVEEAVSAAIFQHHTGAFSESEMSGEGHIILDTEASADGSETTVYALTSYGGYQFQNGNFVKSSGTGAIPAVISLMREPDGSYLIKHFQLPLDGGEQLASIHELFPEALWEQCIAVPDETYGELKKQEYAYAADYLESIGREYTVIGDYSDFQHPLLTDAGISVETSNKLSDRAKNPEAPALYAPSFLGTIERVEDGVRYVYQTSCDPENKEVIYSKFVYDTDELVEKVIYDSDTGKIK